MQTPCNVYGGCRYKNNTPLLVRHHLLPLARAVTAAVALFVSLSVLVLLYTQRRKDTPASYGSRLSMNS